MIGSRESSTLTCSKSAWLFLLRLTTSRTTINVTTTVRAMVSKNQGNKQMNVRHEVVLPEDDEPVVDCRLLPAARLFTDGPEVDVALVEDDDEDDDDDDEEADVDEEAEDEEADDVDDDDEAEDEEEEFVHPDGVQVNPGSTVIWCEHPSPLTMLPSSPEEKMLVFEQKNK